VASLNRLGDHNYPLVRSPSFWFCLAYCGFIGGKRIPINRKRTKQVILRWPIRGSGWRSRRKRWSKERWWRCNWNRRKLNERLVLARTHYRTKRCWNNRRLLPRRLRLLPCLFGKARRSMTSGTSLSAGA